jgi:CRP-like cAMP-binding protein
MHTVIQWQDKIISIDLPMNAAYLLKQVSISPTEIDAVVFTHNHDDHVGELSMLLSMGKKVTIICPKIIWKSILLKASYLFGMSINELTSYFDYRPIRYGKENEYDYSGLRIEAHPSIHSVPCAIYRIRGRVGQAWKVYSHLSDILNFHHCQILLDKGYITRQRFNSYRAFLLRPATVKKVDVGTVDGKEKFSVHGSWKDFSQDTSDQIVLAHIQRIKLNQAATMTLGQFATVGSAKVLGDDSRRSDHTQSKKRALRYLAKYFFELKPEAKQTQKSRVDKELDDYLGKLVNSDILIIQPNTPFIKISDSATFVDLVISGIGSIWIPKGTEWQQIAKVHPGDIVGEIGVLLGKPRNASVYADTYMRVLRMPASLFRETSAYAGLFMASNEGILQKVWRCREIVQSSRLFGDEVPIYLQNKIARYAREITLNKGNLILSQKDEESSIFLGTNPALFAMKNDHLKREKGCFKLPVFGERGFMTGEPDRYQIVACKEANMLQLDREKFSWVREIPLFKLRLKELVEQRKILCGETSPPVNFS